MPGWFARRIKTERRKPQREEPALRAEIPQSLAATASGGLASALRDHLRQWRREVAKRQNTAAFIVMHDTTIDALCVKQPRTLAELRGIPGIGERKIELYGKEILQVLAEFRGGAA
jgi:ATP-dependent DNA helicase RecQ